MNNALHFGSASDEWSTPPDLFARLDREFHFTLDAASTHENAKCVRHLTKGDDALAADWRILSQRPGTWPDSRGAVFVNPPYSRGLQARFIQKARDEAAKAFGPIVVCLIPARPDTLIWHKVVFPCAHVRFLKGRVRFTGAKASAPFPSAVVIFGLDPKDHEQRVTGWDWKT